MSFQSYGFLLIFLPLAAIVYPLVLRRRAGAAKLCLLAASVVFYGIGAKWLFVVPAVGIAVSFLAARSLRRGKRRAVLAAAVLWHIAVLCFFKYSGLGVSPLGLSFFTFQQIWYLALVWRGQADECGIADYCLFSLFFPTVSSGPILRSDKLLPQLAAPKAPDWEDRSAGLYAVAVGLGKKLLLADSLGVIVASGYSQLSSLGTFTALIVILGYTLQLYFDFSGYCDIALGAARLLGLRLPKNFDSPYRALSVTDFWKRWHITLTDFLRECIYFPLGGSRRGQLRALLNILIVYLISGLWHGTGITFIIWGMLHALAMIAEKLLKPVLGRIPRLIRWALTFAYVNLAWIFFRAPSLDAALQLIRAVFRPSGVSGSNLLSGVFTTEISAIEGVFPALAGRLALPVGGALFLAGMIAALWPKNLFSRLESFRPSAWKAVAAVVLLVWAVLSLGGIPTFIYSNF